MKENPPINVKLILPHSIEQENFVRCMAKRQAAKSGRRWGKTVGAAIKDVEAFLGICSACRGQGCEFCKNTGRVSWQRVLYAAPTAEQVGKYWYEVCNMLAPAIDAHVFYKNETERYIEIPGTERRLKAKTAWHANSLRGDFGSRVTLDEFQLMNEDVLEVVLPMLADTDGGLVLIFTPPSLKSEGVSRAKDPRHASKLYKKWAADTTGRCKTFHFTSFDNPTLSKEALNEMSSDMSIEAYRREILAEDDEIESSWLVYNKFKEDMNKVRRFDIPKEWPLLTGHDFGMANPAALFVARAQLPLPDGVPENLRYGDYVIFKEYAPGAGSSTSQHVDKFKDITMGHRVEISVGGNLTTEQEIREGYGRAGWPIAPPLVGKINPQVDRVKALMGQGKIFIFEDLFKLLTEIANCMWELDDEKVPKDKIQNESKYHLLSCLRTLATYLPVERPVFNYERPKVKVW